jgi:hypothetical protein
MLDADKRLKRLESNSKDWENCYVWDKLGWLTLGLYVYWANKEFRRGESKRNKYRLK